MPKIVITEQDLTSPGVLAESTDVVYIPGFVDTDITKNPDLYSNGEYVGLEVNKPTLMTSLTQFQSLCGTQPATFAKNQMYRDLFEVAGDEIKGFDSAAIPYHGVMFNAGQADPSYVMAKEILSAGLNVIYERVNKDSYTTDFDPKKDDKPSDWSYNFRNYQVGTTAYEAVKTAAPPEPFVKVNGEKFDETQTYYVKSIFDSAIRFLKTDDVIKDSDGTISNYEKDIVPVYYIHVPAYEGADEHETNYFMLSKKLSFTVTPEYEPSKYYVFQTSQTRSSNGSYVLVTDTDAPSDWGTGNYYTKTDDTYAQVVFSIQPALVADKYVKYDNVQDIYVPVQLGDSDWGNNSVSFYELSEIKLTDTVVDNAAGYILPTSWVTGFANGVIKTTQFNSVESIDDWDNADTIRLSSTGIDIKHMYDALESLYAITDSGLSDRGNYSIKYLTSGGYPTYEYSQNSLVTKMMTLAENRGDCVAFIDHTDNPYREENIDHVGSLYNTVKNDVTFQEHGDFATMFTPWATYNRASTDRDKDLKLVDGYDSSVRMPGSFAYFLSLADSISVNPNWLAIAGVARGIVQNLAQNGMTTNIPNGAADRMTPRDATAINPITNIKPYGYTIWGNRTLKKNADNLTASSFLNIRNLVSDIKKEVYRTARKLTFEQNSDVLWVNFKAEISPLLDKMLHGYGISSYKLALDTNHPKFRERATLCVKIIISPIEPVEDFYVSILLQDDENVIITE